MAKFYETSIAVSMGVMVLLAICMLPISEAASTSLRLKRSPDTTATLVKTTSECPTSTPCGWAVYTPFSRNVDYFMQNTCNCNSDEKCIRTEDDLSISAYVYRCRITQNGSASPTS